MGVNSEELRFPMPVEKFLRHAGQLLLRSDVILSRSPTLSSWLIRFGTGGYFSHAALVFLVPKPEEGFTNTFLLESVSAGVGLANLREYVDRRRGHSDLVIRRLNAPWFNDQLRAQVRGLMLDHVKAGYDYGIILRMALSVLFGLRLGLSRVAKGRGGSMADAVKKTHRRRRRWVPPQFICSGFVQYGFAEALRRNKLRVADVLFRAGMSPTDSSAMLAVTPEDIATSDRLDWLYAITEGKVHRVTSYDEAKRIISAARQ